MAPIPTNNCSSDGLDWSAAREGLFDGVSRLLELLDKRGGPKAAGHDCSGQAGHFHGSVLVELSGTGLAAPTASAARSISPTGMSLLLPRFAYPGTACRIRLASRNGQAASAAARVVRCQYLPGTHRIHDVGVEFTEPIDVTPFTTAAAGARILLVDNDQRHARVMAAMLKPHGMQVDAFCGIEEVPRLQPNSRFDLLVVSDAANTDAADCLALRLRRDGVIVPLVTMLEFQPAAQEPPERCGPCGQCSVLGCSHADVKREIHSHRREPVKSSFAGDPVLWEAINTFVAQLHGWIIELRDAIAARNVEHALQIAGSVAVLAESVGFDPIAEQARSVANLLGTSTDCRPARQAFAYLATLAVAVRPAPGAPGADSTPTTPAMV